MKAQREATLGFFFEDRYDDGHFFKRTDEITLFGADSAIDKHIVLTVDEFDDVYQRVACGQIEQIDCRELD